jgi:hypothetical protein
MSVFALSENKNIVIEDQVSLPWPDSIARFFECIRLQIKPDCAQRIPAINIVSVVAGSWKKAG